MPLMRWDPFTALAHLDTEFDGVMRQVFGASTSQYVPPVEMTTEGSDVVISLEVPGVDVEDIDIEVANNKLAISGERKEQWSEDTGTVLVRELRYGSFKRVFQLPSGVTADNIEATADKGLLSIRVKDIAKPEISPKRITITDSSPPQKKSIAAGSEKT